MNEALSAIELETAPDPQFSVIWLHGLGADGSDFVPIVPELRLKAPVRFIFPNAPEIPVTCNGGWVMPAWYDILSLAPTERRVDEGGILRSREAVRALVARENARGIASRRIVLAGFSQGGAIAYTAALTHPERLAGVLALSTYLPSPKLVDAERTEANAGLPFFVAHGEDDDVVTPALGRGAVNYLLARDYPVDCRNYPMAHEVCAAEIRDIADWLGTRLGT